MNTQTPILPPSTSLAPLTTQEIYVQRSGFGDYTTNVIRGMRSSCTYSADVAAKRQADKLFGPALLDVHEVKEGSVFIRRFIASADPSIKAFCWANGRIQMDDTVPDGAIFIAKGPHRALFAELYAHAVKGTGSAEGWLLAPGVADAGQADDAVEALIQWVDVRARTVNNSKTSFGVQYYVRPKAGAQAASPERRAA